MLLAGNQSSRSARSLQRGSNRGEICNAVVAHTDRRLKPGTFEQFAETFGPPKGAGSPGWVRFYMLRAIADENEVTTFGFFNGTVEQLEASQDELGYSETRDAIEPLVDAVLANGLYEIVKSRAAAGEAAV